MRVDAVDQLESPASLPVLVLFFVTSSLFHTRMHTCVCVRLLHVRVCDCACVQLRVCVLVGGMMMGEQRLLV